VDFDPAFWQPTPHGSTALLPLTAPARPRYLEDFAVGEAFETASRRVELDEIVAFAKVHDPQYFHTDPERARTHPVFRGISASGFLTLTITHRLILAVGRGQAWGLIGKGLQELRWRRPVRPGDTLRVQGLITSVTRDPAHGYGIVATAVETLNQRGETVMSFTVEGIVPARDAMAPAARAA
jgi:acyl dehydratase